MLQTARPFALALSLVASTAAQESAGPTPSELWTQAHEAHEAGDTTLALELLDRYLALDEHHGAGELEFRIGLLVAQGDDAAARRTLLELVIERPYRLRTYFGDGAEAPEWLGGFLEDPLVAGTYVVPMLRAEILSQQDREDDPEYAALLLRAIDQGVSALDEPPFPDEYEEHLERCYESLTHVELPHEIRIEVLDALVETLPETVWFVEERATKRHAAGDDEGARADAIRAILAEPGAITTWLEFDEELQQERLPSWLDEILDDERIVDTYQGSMARATLLAYTEGFPSPQHTAALDRAAALCAAELSERPDDVDLRATLVSIYREGLGSCPSHVRRIDLNEHVLEIEPDDLPTRWDLALALFEDGRKDEAAAHLRRWRKATSDTPRTFEVAVHDVDLALELLEDASLEIRLDELAGFVARHTWRGVAIAEEVAEHAFEVGRQVQRLSNSDVAPQVLVDAYAELAWAQERDERPTAALVTLTRGVVETGSPGLRMRRAWLRGRMEDPLGAVGDLETARETIAARIAAAEEDWQKHAYESDDRLALTWMGIYERKLGNALVGLDHINAAVDPEWGPTTLQLHHRALCQRDLGNLDAAREDARAAILGYERELAAARAEWCGNANVYRGTYEVELAEMRSIFDHAL